MKTVTLEEIKCPLCKGLNYLDPMVLSKPVVIHCIYCTKKLVEGKRVNAVIG